MTEYISQSCQPSSPRISLHGSAPYDLCTNYLSHMESAEKTVAEMCDLCKVNKATEGWKINVQPKMNDRPYSKSLTETYRPSVEGV